MKLFVFIALSLIATPTVFASMLDEKYPDIVTVDPVTYNGKPVTSRSSYSAAICKFLGYKVRLDYTTEALAANTDVFDLEDRGEGIFNLNLTSASANATVYKTITCAR